MDHRITSVQPFVWTEFTNLLAGKQIPIELRMVDGQLCFPNELPPENWHEVRIACPHGMITLRRAGATIDVVTWGNADQALRQAWNAIAWSVATATGGTVDGQAPADFAAAELPPD